MQQPHKETSARRARASLYEGCNLPEGGRKASHWRSVSAATTITLSPSHVTFVMTHMPQRCQAPHFRSLLSWSGAVQDAIPGLPPQQPVALPDPSTLILVPRPTTSRHKVRNIALSSVAALLALILICSIAAVWIVRRHRRRGVSEPTWMYSTVPDARLSSRKKESGSANEGADKDAALWSTRAAFDEGRRSAVPGDLGLAPWATKGAPGVGEAIQHDNRADGIPNAHGVHIYSPGGAAQSEGPQDVQPVYALAEESKTPTSEGGGSPCRGVVSPSSASLPSSYGLQSDFWQPALPPHYHGGGGRRPLQEDRLFSGQPEEAQSRAGSSSAGRAWLTEGGSTRSYVPTPTCMQESARSSPLTYDDSPKPPHYGAHDALTPPRGLCNDDLATNQFSNRVDEAAPLSDPFMGEEKSLSNLPEDTCAVAPTAPVWGDTCAVPSTLSTAGKSGLLSDSPVTLPTPPSTEFQSPMSHSYMPPRVTTSKASAIVKATTSQREPLEEGQHAQLFDKTVTMSNAESNLSHESIMDMLESVFVTGVPFQGKCAAATFSVLPTVAAAPGACCEGLTCRGLLSRLSAQWKQAC
jgi:hypothetical protein